MVPKCLLIAAAILSAGLLAACQQTARDLGAANLDQHPGARIERDGRLWPDWQKAPAVRLPYGFESRAAFAWDKTGLYGRLSGVSTEDAEVRLDLRYGRQTASTVVVSYHLGVDMFGEGGELPGYRSSMLATAHGLGGRRQGIGPGQFASRSGVLPPSDSLFGGGVRHAGEFWVAWAAMGIHPEGEAADWELHVSVAPVDRQDQARSTVLTSADFQSWRPVEQP